MKSDLYEHISFTQNFLLGNFRLRSKQVSPK